MVLRKKFRASIFLMAAFGLVLLGQTKAKDDTLAGVKKKTEIDALVEKILQGEVEGPQSLFERENGPYRIITSYINNRKGVAESHGNVDELFLILSGSAEFTLGGEIVDKKAIRENEFRGLAIDGGTIHSIGVGDLISIPRGLAHQMNPGTGHILYIVIKIIADQ